jgi:pimeloyl-ACP methyl ester carboxylesterase
MRPCLRGVFALVLGAQQVLAAEGERPRRAGDTVMETGASETHEGVPVAYELGTLFVPENRAVPESRPIGVGFGRIRSVQNPGGPPVFILAGGPGSSLLDTFTSHDVASRRRLALWVGYSAAGDVVVVDQRGHSKRGEVLEYVTPKRPLDKPRSRDVDAREMAASAQAALRAHPDKDLAGYTIVQAAEDVNSLRQALGYKQLTLYGASFGSQWSLMVMRLHPDIVARALLTDVEPLDFGYDMPSHVFAAFQRIAWDADRDPGLVPYLPPGGVLGAWREVRERLAKRPLRIQVKDETTGKTQTVVLGLEDFQSALLRPAEDWPAFMLSLYHSHYDGWARETIAQRQSDAPAPLIGPLFDTSLGVSAEREHLLRTDSGTEFMGQGAFHAYLASASSWPSPDVGDALRLTVPTAVPVLFLHGDWDTSTPIENLLNLLPYFPNSRSLLVHRGTHGDRKTLREQHPALWEQLVAFLRTGDARDIPVQVTLQVPVFQRPPFPAPAKPAL